MATAPGASAAPWLSNPTSSTPPTPAQARDSIELRSPLCENRIATLNAVPPHTPASAGPPYTPALCTPANAPCSITPPENLRRQSLVVPPSAHMVHLARGSGVSVYRMNRSPREGRARSPWVIKKSEEGILVRRRPVSPTPARSPAHARPSACVCAQARERRRVERALELESRVLSRIEHPHIVGFRAAQRLPDGRLGLVLEACECSLYGLIQERQFELGCPPRPFLAAADVLTVATGIALALVHLHDEMALLHGDIKSANVLVSRDLSLVKAHTPTLTRAVTATPTLTATPTPTPTLTPTLALTPTVTLTPTLTLTLAGLRPRRGPAPLRVLGARGRQGGAAPAAVARGAGLPGDGGVAASRGVLRDD